MRHLITGFVILAVAATAAATDLKVPSDDFPTIQSAADVAQPGDRILVAKGTYQENVTLNVSDVQIIGKKAVWDGAIGPVEGVCLTATGDDILVQGFTFRNGADQLVLTGARIRVQKCVFRAAGDNGVEITGADAVVTSCQFHWTEAAGVIVSGNTATVEKCKFTNTDDGAVEVTGDDGLVQKNTANMVEDDEAYYVSGARARVLKNKAYGSEGCVTISGDDCVVEGNSGGYYGGEFIDVTGNNFTIRSNKCSFTTDDEDGISVSGSNGLIEGNKLTDVIEDGFSLSVSNTTIRGNSIQRSGSESDEGFEITGDGNTIEGNRALDIDDDAFYVSGIGNILVGNLAQNCGGDGFEINGDGNTLENCTAKGAMGEGLDNSGTNTEVTRGSFTGNRIDIAGNSNFKVFEGVKFVSGGETQVPELD